jgi:threonine dehydrogenase-like Zn-dependent dehydrogenase
MRFMDIRMRCLTVEPLVKGSARIDDLRAPEPAPSQLLLGALAVGVCGTDHEIIDGRYGSAPPGHTRLIIGHECVARVIRAPAGSRFRPGDHVVPIVRHPDPVPCINCAAGEWDMCRNGRYTEHGIKDLDGFACDMFVMDPAYTVPADASLGLAAVLVEPASIVAKAWEHVERIGTRARWKPRTALVTGAGPIGLLAALIARQHDLDVCVFDGHAEGLKPRLAAELGATYVSGALDDVQRDFDIVFECTGAAPVIGEVLGRTARDGIICLLGVSSGGHIVDLDLGSINRELVLENQVVFGCVNANRRHYEAAVQLLHAADRGWLDSLITRRVPVDHFEEAFHRELDDVKVVITFDPVDTNTQ